MSPRCQSRARAIARAALSLGSGRLGHAILTAADEESLHQLECLAAACSLVDIVARDPRAGVEAIGELLSRLVAEELAGDEGIDSPVPYSLADGVPS